MKAVKKAAEKAVAAEDRAVEKTSGPRSPAQAATEKHASEPQPQGWLDLQGAARTVKLNELWGHRKGLIGWLSQVDHKSIGMRYIVSGFIFFALAGIGSLLMS